MLKEVLLMKELPSHLHVCRLKKWPAWRRHLTTKSPLLDRFPEISKAAAAQRGTNNPHKTAAELWGGTSNTSAPRGRICLESWNVAQTHKPLATDCGSESGVSWLFGLPTARNHKNPCQPRLVGSEGSL